MISIAVGMLVASGSLIVVGVLLLYIWKVPSLISELSGKTSRETIRKLQKINSSDDVMNTTDFYNAVSSGALSDHDIDDTDGKTNTVSTGSGMDEILSHIPSDEGKRSGRRRKQTRQSVEVDTTEAESTTEGLGKGQTSGLSTSLLGSHGEAASGVLDFTEDVSTGYFSDADEVLRVDTPIGAFSSTRVVLVTREYSSLAN